MVTGEAVVLNTVTVCQLSFAVYYRAYWISIMIFFQIPGNMEGFNARNETIKLPPTEVMPPILLSQEQNYKGTQMYMITGETKGQGQQNIVRNNQSIISREIGFSKQTRQCYVYHINQMIALHLLKVPLFSPLILNPDLEETCSALTFHSFGSD